MTSSPLNVSIRDIVSDAGWRLWRDGQTPVAYVASLRDAALLEDAVRVLAYWLPKRSAIWWGCQCFWSVREITPLEPRWQAALDRIVHWVIAPSELLRRQCEPIAERLTAGTALGALAWAVFVSEGSISAPMLPPVIAPAPVTAKAVIIALTVLTAGRDPKPVYREFIHLGMDIANGRNLWS